MPLDLDYPDTDFLLNNIVDTDEEPLMVEAQPIYEYIYS